MEGIFTVASATVKDLPLELHFPPGVVGRCHGVRNISCFNVLIQKEDNVPQATIDLVLQSVGLPNDLLHQTEPSEVQRKLPIRDEWA